MRCPDPKVQVFAYGSSLTGGTTLGPVVPMQPGEPLRIGDYSQENILKDNLADEQVKIAGTPVDYWSISVPCSVKDPLYGESIERKFIGPYRLMGIFKAPDHQPMVREEGLVETYTGSVWIARKAFEDIGAPKPAEGDVVRAWDLPIYAALSTPEVNTPENAGYYFDVLHVDVEGYATDSPVFVGWNIQLKRRSEFTAERRLHRP